MKAIEYHCTIKSFEMLTPTVFQTEFETHPSLSFKAGQFISIIIPGAGPKGRDLRRAYSIASSPESKIIQLCVRLVDEGPGTNFLHKLKPGDQLKGWAPYGNFIYKTPSEKHACFISTGTGISPFRSILESNHYKENPPLSAHLLHGVRTEDELLYSTIFSNLPKTTFVQAVSQPSPQWSGYKGRVTDYLRELKLVNNFDWISTEYYLCGNGAMINEVKTLLLEKGVPKGSIHLEVYYK
jgi:ferredoxin-NADP reductase